MRAFVNSNNGDVYTESFILRDDEEKKKLFEKREPRTPSRGRQFVVLAACLLLQVVSNGIGFGLGVMYVEVIQAFGAASSTAALIQSLFMSITSSRTPYNRDMYEKCGFGSIYHPDLTVSWQEEAIAIVVLMPIRDYDYPPFLPYVGILWAPVLRRYGSGKCALAGAITASAGLFASSFSTSVYMIIGLTGIVASLGMCVSYLAPFIVVSLFFRERAGVALVILTTGCSLGQFIFPNLYELFISTYGWSGAFVLISGLALQGIPAALVLHGSRDFMAEMSEVRDRASADTQNGCTACNLDWSLLTQGVYIVTLSNCFFLSSTGNLEGWFLVDMMLLKGFERETGSLFVSMLGLMNFFGRITGVILRLKVSAPTMHHWVYIAPVMGVLHFMILQFTSYWSLLTACLLYGYVFGTAAALTPAIMLEVAGLERYTDAMAFVNVCYGIGNLFGGSLGGIVKDSYGAYDPMFYLAISACLYIAASTCGLIVVVRRRARGDNPDITHTILK